MGLLRLLLALSVVAAHVGNLPGLSLIGGKMAVQSFFIISGFFMALILSEKYEKKKQGYFYFITNRFLRIFPPYYVVLVLTLLASIIWIGHGMDNPLALFLKHMHQYHPFTTGYLVFSNLFIFGQDIGMFLGLNPHTGLLFFNPSLDTTRPFIYGHLFIPQAWTLGIELLFYLVAPIIVKLRVRYLFLLAFLSLVLRFGIYHMGFHHEPWTNRFFLTEFLFFFLGVLSYHLYVFVKAKKTFQAIGKVLFGIVILFTIVYPYLPSMLSTSFNPLQWMYYLTLVLCLPFIFATTQKSKIDRRLGDLAYPVYISHVFIAFVVSNLRVGNGFRFAFVVTAGTVIFSYLMLFFLIDPIDRFRQKRVQHARKT